MTGERVFWIIAVMVALVVGNRGDIDLSWIPLPEITTATAQASNAPNVEPRFSPRGKRKEKEVHHDL
jgi:hypothetical protein